MARFAMTFLLVLTLLAGLLPGNLVAAPPPAASSPSRGQTSQPAQATTTGRASTTVGAGTELGVVTNAVTRNRTRPNLPLYFNLVADTGAGWVREEFRWDLIQPQPGSWEWEGHDHTVAAYQREGLKIIGLLAYSAGWAVGDSLPSSPLPPPPAAWAEYVAATVSRYRDHVTAWEIWNEPDHELYWKSDPRMYAAFLGFTAPLIRQHDPDAVILSGGVADLPNGLRFLEVVGAAGGLAVVDGVAVHPYLDYHGFLAGAYRDAQLDSLRAFHERVGRPLWITEFGFSSSIEGGGKAGEGAQASALVRQIVETAGAPLDVRAMVIYGAADDAQAGDRQDEHNGLLRYDGRTPKQAYHAVRTLGRVLTGLRSVVRLSLDDPLVTRYRFDRGDGTVTDVLWTEGSARTVTLDTVGPVEVTGLTGTLQTIPATLGQVVLGVATAPLYVTYQPSPAGLRYLAESGHTLSGAFLQEWLAWGGLAGLGLPLTEPVPYPGHWVQYFERGRLEFDGAMRLGLTGVETAGRYPAQARDPLRCAVSPGGSARSVPSAGQAVPLPACPTDTPTRRYFPQTGHTLAHGMLAYWEAQGGLRRFGLPISEEFADPGGGGSVLQLFERARLEYNPTTGTITVGLTGKEAMEARRADWPFWPTSPLSLNRGRVYFPQTGHALTPAAALAWTRFGGVALLGYPLSEEYLLDGALVQHFERGRLVWSASGDPTLAHVGREHAALQADPAVHAALAPYPCLPPGMPNARQQGLVDDDNRPRCRLDAAYFPETQHSLRGAFLAYWSQHGGLARFGYPISEQFLLDGQVVQYFERARFELAPSGEVRLSRLGAALVPR